MRQSAQPEPERGGGGGEGIELEAKVAEDYHGKGSSPG